MHYWVASEVCTKPRDSRTYVDPATRRAILSDAKLETSDEGEI